MMIGGYIWGSLGDSLGRRVVLLNAMLGMAHIILIIEQIGLYFEDTEHISMPFIQMQASDFVVVTNVPDP
jgi:hypothetical protein